MPEPQFDYSADSMAVRDQIHADALVKLREHRDKGFMLVYDEGNETLRVTMSIDLGTDAENLKSWAESMRLVAINLYRQYQQVQGLVSEDE